MEIRVLLAGASGVGKTTLAKMVAEEMGLPLYTVKFDNCLEYSDVVERQRCFLEFYENYPWYRPGVYDNSPLTLLAYTGAYATNAKRREKKRLKEIAKRAAELHNNVVLGEPRAVEVAIVGGCMDYDASIVPADIHEAAMIVVGDMAMASGMPLVANVCGHPGIAAEYIVSVVRRLALDGRDRSR